MKLLLTFSLLLTTIFLSSCAAIETIFKAGMWWAFILIGLVVAVILYVVFKTKRK